ncbi:MAG: bifunctional diaminohydroxyphosphoribosylaminopyrimidine deaminase/5-amino-6-(5-phosphoribosylamino)uracil reductase RibD [Oscillospiraceae bacterium]
MNDNLYMQRAIDLAKNGIGFVNPNPLVGAVIVKDNKIIGEGYHAKYGDLHAERNAFKNCSQDCTGATMYVTLEPCCHHGKQPPCVEAIVERGISKVVIGSRDPNPLVSGKGVEYLKNHNIEVTTDFMRYECDKLNDIFFHYITTGRPYVILKSAMTLDGKIASYIGKSKWISCEQSRKHTHQTRKRVSAIMVGIGTVLADNPMLNCRVENPSNPIRIVCDSNLRIPLDCKLVTTAKDIPTYVATISNDIKKISSLENFGIKIIKTKSKNDKVDLSQLIEILGDLKIDSVLIEGGAELNFSALESNIVDCVQIYLSPMILGGVTAKTSVGGIGFENPDLAKKFKLIKNQPIGNDLFLEYKKI